MIQNNYKSHLIKQRYIKFHKETKINHKIYDPLSLSSWRISVSDLLIQFIRAVHQRPHFSLPSYFQ